jgi:hypothetical protein
VEVRQGTFVEAREICAVARPLADAAPSEHGSEQAGVATTPEPEGERLRAQSSVGTSPGTQRRTPEGGKGLGVGLS